MFSSSHSLHTSQWLDEWQHFMKNLGEIENSVPQTLRSRLLSPLNSGDPIFASMLSRELMRPDRLQLFTQVLGGAVQHSESRILLCEIIFNLCKCTSSECRLFIASLIPSLLACEWILGGGLRCLSLPSSPTVCGKPIQTLNSKSVIKIDDHNHLDIITKAYVSDDSSVNASGKHGGDDDEIPEKNEFSEQTSLDEDLAAIEVAILAIYQQDYNINPIPIITRIPALTKPSIYHAGAKDLRFDPLGMGSSDQNLTEIRPSASINPLKPVTRLDGHSRSVITHRLCRCVQDHLPDLEDQVVLLYTLLLSSFCDSNSTFKIKQEPKFHSEILKEIESVIGSNQPLVTKSSVSAFFWDSSILRYPVKEALLLLWSDALPILRLRFPSLSRFIHESMLNRSTRQIMPAALLSLDAFNH